MSEILFEELTFPSADGSTQLHGYIWRPDTDAVRGIIQLSHGMCEYVQRYDAWARRFCAEGFIFCGNDHLGHGQAAADAGNLGYTAHRGGDAFLVEDLHAMSILMRERFPDLPLVLYGHSMGSFAARRYLSLYGGELAAALISGTAGPEQPAGVARKLAHALERLHTDRYRSKFLTSIAFGSYNRKFAKEKDSLSWLSSRGEVRLAYRKDPLCRFVFTLAGYDTLFSLLQFVSRRDWAATVPENLPMLLFAGDMDPVGNYGKGVREVYRRLTEAGRSRVQMKLYGGGRHEMHNEVAADEVFTDLIAFLGDNGL